MVMARFYSNENLPMAIVETLRSLGHDVLTSYEAGKANQGIPDDGVLAYAIAENRSVITLTWIIHEAVKKEKKESLKWFKIKLSRNLSLFIVP